jgi:ribonuclease P protein component
MDDEENISAEPLGSQAPTRIPLPHGDQGGSQSACPAQGQGAKAPLGVTGSDRMVERLKKRRDFQAAAKGQKAARRAFVLEVRKRGDQGPPRFGFTVSKRVATKAVERNRIRRRLKEVARQAAPQAQCGYDYVLVGRHATLREPFRELTTALHEALSEMRGDAGATSKA